MEHLAKHKIPAGPVLLLVWLVLLAGPVSCEDMESDKLPHTDQELNELLILPEDPQSTDQILVIETICGNESDAIISFTGREIHYKRYVNSLMMMPCSPRPDTTVIGQLNAGTYQLIHTVIDRNHTISDSIVGRDTLYLHIR